MCAGDSDKINALCAVCHVVWWGRMPATGCESHSHCQVPAASTGMSTPLLSVMHGEAAVQTFEATDQLCWMGAAETRVETAHASSAMLECGGGAVAGRPASWLPPSFAGLMSEE